MVGHFHFVKTWVNYFFRVRQWRRQGRMTGMKKPAFAGLISGAQKRTRTSTELPPLAPEASASTNSATWALQEPPFCRRVRGVSSIGGD